MFPRKHDDDDGVEKIDDSTGHPHSTSFKRHHDHHSDLE